MCVSQLKQLDSHMQKILRVEWISVLSYLSRTCRPCCREYDPRSSVVLVPAASQLDIINCCYVIFEDMPAGCCLQKVSCEEGGR